MASAAPAQPDAPRSEPTKAQKDKARGLMNEGHRQYKGGDYRSALKAFQEADDIMGVPTTSLYVAKAQIELGLLVEALDALDRVQSYPRAPKEPKPFERARVAAEVLQAELSQRIPTLEVALADLPAGTTANVAIDGAQLALERVHLPLKLNPGGHRVAVSAPGFVPYEESVELQESERRRLEVKLAPAPKAPPLPPPPPPTEPDIADEPVVVPPLAWAAFGVGAAGLVVGTVAGAVAVSQDSTLGEACQDKRCPSDKEADIDRLKTTAHVSTAGFAVAGVGAAVGLILVLVSDDSTSDPTSDEPQSGVVVQPALGLGTAAIIGRF